MMRMPRPSLALVLGALIGGAALLQSATADAGRIRFGGGARFAGRIHSHGGRTSIRFARPHVRSRVFVGGNIWLGGYYYPRPYYYYYYPSYVPSYYGGYYGSYYNGSYNTGSYYPVQPPAAQAVVAAPPQRPLPMFGIGVSAGGTAVADRSESSDLSALVRLRLTEGLLIEGELGKTEFENDVRIDRRIGGSMVWEIGARNTFAPYLLGGLGVQQAEVGDSFSTTQQFGELGVGLRLALGRNLHLTADIRAGRRQATDSEDFLAAERTVLAPVPEESEDYTRARLAAFLYF
jgi:hypothetical protein